MARLGIAFVLLVLILYGAWKAVPLLSGPSITLESPKDGQTFSDGFVLIQGIALHTESLSLDGGPLLIDESGHFSTSLVLPPGGAILSLTATDRFGKSVSVRRSVFVPNP